MEKYFVRIGNGVEVTNCFEQVLKLLLDALEKKQVIIIGLSSQSKEAGANDPLPA